MSKLLKTLSLATALAFTAIPCAKAEGFSGAFLAAKSANLANDYAEAAYYYTQAMVAEPDNAYIMQGAIFALVASGDVLAGNAIARKMAAAGLNDESAQTVLIAQAFERAAFDTVLGLLADTNADLNPLIKQVATGWALIGRGDIEAGLDAFSEHAENEAIAAFGLYNKGLALAYTGDFCGRRRRFPNGWGLCEPWRGAGACTDYGQARTRG